MRNFFLIMERTKAEGTLHVAVYCGANPGNRPEYAEQAAGSKL